MGCRRTSASFIRPGTSSLPETDSSCYARSAFGAEQGTLPARHAATLNFFNPAFFALLFAPFSSLSFARAFQLWTLLNLGLLAVSCRLIWEIADPLERRWLAS